MRAIVVFVMRLMSWYRSFLALYKTTLRLQLLCKHEKPASRTYVPFKIIYIPSGSVAIHDMMRRKGMGLKGPFGLCDVWLNADAVVDAPLWLSACAATDEHFRW
jgi:hypothetical protein